MAKIQKIESLFAEVKADLEELRKETETNQAKKTTKENATPPTSEECRQEFDRLYNKYITGNIKATEDFINEKSKEYLRVFCKENSLSVDTKRASKKEVSSEILQWFAQRKAIAGRTVSS